MADVAPQFEGQDNSGSTVVFTGTASTSNQSLPASSGAKITEFLVVNSVSPTSNHNKTLLFSMDGGTNFTTLLPGGFFGWKPKGITQIIIKGGISGVTYEVTLNLEAVTG